MQILRNHGHCIILSKCQLAQQEVQFLSYLINENGIKAPTTRIKAIQKNERPSTINQLGRCLGRCLPNSSHIQESLTEVLKNVKKWQACDRVDTRTHRRICCMQTKRYWRGITCSSTSFRISGRREP